LTAVCVFVGPTLGLDEARAELDAVYLPPVAQGDVYRASRAGARAIGIIDGYFERMPAVWHKEILWAMAEGVHVFGSASMGALRAAELAAFGMVGVGAIFEAFANGSLEDDDEVAVAHGPAETGFVAGSEALVNIRATLAAACAQGVISEATAEALVRIAKDLFYPDRSFPIIVARAAQATVPSDELASLEAWLPRGRVDLKRQDALAMLRAMREHVASTPEPKRVRYTFERTVWWEQATITAGELHIDREAGGEALLLSALLEELQLEGHPYAAARDRALLEYLSVRHANQARATPSTAVRQATADRVRLRLGLPRADDVERWLEENHLSRQRLTDLIVEQALVEWTSIDLTAEVTRRIPDQLRLSGRYVHLDERARHKQRTLAAHGWESPSLEDTGLDRARLLDWHLNRLGQPRPSDLESYARQSGFADAESFVRALVREFCYLRCLGQEVGYEFPASAV
jgi:hypothetical protein